MGAERAGKPSLSNAACVAFFPHAKKGGGHFTSAPVFNLDRSKESFRNSPPNLPARRSNDKMS